ncbi:MAG TPA: hypothetical protein PKO06_10265, partial [Candidatus Ozemobacteraceae bacterium]|nr:hypothetical protein [Candidatus Ozemobacteraceae bacterium]
RIKIDEVTADIDAYDPVTGLVRFTPRTSLGEGVHIAIFYAYDLAGNAANPAAVSFEVAFPKTKDTEGREVAFRDRHVPTITELEPAEGTTVYSANPVISCRLFDAESGIDPQTISFWLNDEKIANHVTYYIPGRTGEDWDWWSYQRDVILYNPLSGKVMFSPVKPLDEKTAWYSFSYEACDRQGNPVRSPTIKFKVVIDRQPPSISAFEPADQAVLTSLTPAIKAQISDKGGSGVSKRDLRLFFDGDRISTEDLDYDEKTGLLSWVPPLAVDPDQQHIVSLIVFDRAGNRSPESVATFFVRPDTQAPILSSAQPRSGQVISTRTGSLYLRWLDPGFSGLDDTTTRIALDGRAVLPDNPDTSFIDGYRLKFEDLSGKRVARVEIPISGAEALGQGTHQLIVSIADRAGNRSSPEVIDFRVSDDITAPVITALTPENISTIAPTAIRVSASFTDEGSGIDLNRVILALNGQRIAISPEHLASGGQLSLTIMPSQPLEKQSLHLLSLTVYDLAGNRSESRVHVLRCN